MLPDNEGQSYTFEFFVLISTLLPTITQFSAGGAINAAGYTNISQINYTATLNITDLQTDSVFGNNLYNFSYSFNPTQTNPWDGNSSIDNSSVLRVAAIDGICQTVNFTTGNGSAMYGFNFTMYFSFNFGYTNLFLAWQLQMTFDLIPTINVDLQFLNYTSGTWQTIQSNILNGYSAGSNVTLIFLNSANFNTNIGQFSEHRIIYRPD